MILKFILYFFLIFEFLGCKDDTQVVFYDTSLKTTPIPCLKLSIFPPNKVLTQQLKRVYNFSQECDYTLEVSTKSGITCNSNYNIEKKNISGFPSSYLSLIVKKDFKMLYSYYVDLDHNLVDEDLVNGFMRLKKDLKIIF